MNHKYKVKLARKMMTKKNIEDRTPIFSSSAWEERKSAIEKRIERRNKSRIIQDIIPSEPQIEEKKLNWFQRLLDWLKRFFKK